MYTHDLVDVTKVNPNFILDIKYATKDNFVGEAVYNQAKCYLLKEAASALSEAAKEFAQMGYKIKIWDGYRPQKVQFRFWDLVKDKFSNPEDYVANPNKGSRHNRGAAVDITLTDKNGKELDMGTPFDEFSEKAHRTFKKLSKKVLRNRKMLELVMHKHGFEGLPSEWWHYDFKGWEKYPLLDIDFENLEKIEEQKTETI
jgi:D-alanyl-D-alanine dipeptidase